MDRSTWMDRSTRMTILQMTLRTYAGIAWKRVVAASIFTVRHPATVNRRHRFKAQLELLGKPNGPKSGIRSDPTQSTRRPGDYSFAASHNKVICGPKTKNVAAASWGMRFEVRSTNRSVFAGCVVLTPQRRGLYDSLTDTSITQFCGDARAVCERWRRWASLGSLSIPFDATERRSSIGFRP